VTASSGVAMITTSAPLVTAEISPVCSSSEAATGRSLRAKSAAE
jgi:hypothetical protein